MHINDWLLPPKEGIVPHVMISPFEVYEIWMGINRKHAPGQMEIRVAASGKGGNTYSTLNIMEITSGCIVGNVSEKQASAEMERIQGEIPDPAF